MEKLMVQGYQHAGGKHCWTTALKNVFSYHGLNLSEEMLFGLGGGIGFIYWYMKLMSAPFIGTRYGKGVEPLIDTCRRIGAQATIFQTGSVTKGHEELKKQLRQDEPALVFVDMPYLPYLAIPENAHFGGHTVIVFGLDEQNDTVYISDRCEKPVTIGIEDLKKARSSKFPPFPPKNKLLKLKHPSKITNLEEGITESIRECCNSMLKPPIKNIGLAGMKKWASLVPQWTKQFTGLNLIGCLFNIFLYIEISGTGGSAFRKMYAKFLKEASSILNKPTLKETAEMFSESANLWSEIAKASLPNSWPILERIRSLAADKNMLFEEQKPHTLNEMHRITTELDSLMQRAAQELHLNKLASHLLEIKRSILLCYEKEEKAFNKLNRVIN
jgi:hypothetical protein